MAVKSAINRFKETNLTNIKSKLCDNPYLSDRFIDDVIRITGYDIDEEGYVVDPEENPIEPDYIVIKGKVLRLTNQGIVHAKDLIFDPYNNPMIMEELWKKYLGENHPQVVSSQIYASNEKEVPRVNTFGYITILYNNGAKIKTLNHWKDSTKYLEAFMRMESMTDPMILETVTPYDVYEAEFFKNGNPYLNMR